MKLHALKSTLPYMKAAVVVSLIVASLALNNGSASALAAPQTTYRLYNTASRQHLLTADQNESNVLTQNPVWKSEAPNFSAATCDNTTMAVYRMVNQVSGEHFLTADAYENYLWTSPASYFGHTDYYSEGVAFCAFSTPVAGTKPVNRLVSTVTGEHFLTADANEVSHLTTGPAWRLEKIAFYAY